MNMIRQLRARYTDNLLEHDDTAGEGTMRCACPTFFDNPTRGTRETLTFYRGGVIVRQTRRYSSSPAFRSGLAFRATVVYLFVKHDGGEDDGGGGWHLDYMGEERSIYRAQRLIDRILDTCNMDPDGVPEKTKNG